VHPGTLQYLESKRLAIHRERLEGLTRAAFEIGKQGFRSTRVSVAARVLERLRSASQALGPHGSRAALDVMSAEAHFLEPPGLEGRTERTDLLPDLGDELVEQRGKRGGADGLPECLDRIRIEFRSFDRRSLGCNSADDRGVSAVNATTGICERSPGKARIAAVVSIPFIPGMWMSIRTRS